jgi:hypothetical protein
MSGPAGFSTIASALAHPAPALRRLARFTPALISPPAIIPARIISRYSSARDTGR